MAISSVCTGEGIAKIEARHSCCLKETLGASPEVSDDPRGSGAAGSGGAEDGFCKERGPNRLLPSSAGFRSVSKYLALRVIPVAICRADARRQIVLRA